MNIQQAVKKCILKAYATRSPNTARAYGQSIKLFVESISENTKPSDDIESITINEFIQFPSWLAMREYSKKTMGVYAAGAKYFLEWLIVEEYISPPDYKETLRSQLAYKTVMRKGEQRLVRFPKKGEAEKMLEAVLILNEPSPRKERDVAILHFLYYTGCRNDELVKLDLKDIDINDQSAIVVGKGDKERRVFFNQYTTDKLTEYWNIRDHKLPNDPVFMRHDRGAGKKVLRLTTTTIRNIVNQVADVAGIDKGLFTPHYFRHAFAIKLLRETANLALVQDLMGHASPTSTRVYAKIYPDELKAAHKEVFE